MTTTPSEEEFDCASATDATIISMDTDSDDLGCEDLMILKGICFNKNYNNMMESCPDIYRCPISKALMVKPVMLHADGHTYDEEFLQQWLNQNNISPLTGLPLKQKSFTRNYALQQAIDEFQRLQLKLSKNDPKITETKDNTNKEKTIITEGEVQSMNEKVMDSPEIKALYNFLHNMSLEKYVNIFLSGGFVSMKDLCTVTFPDLVSIGIPVLHARRLINSINEYRMNFRAKDNYGNTEITESIELKFGNGDCIDIPLNMCYGKCTIDDQYQTSSMAPYTSAIIIQPGRVPYSKNSSPLNINVLLLGDAYVGKTSLRKRLELNDFVQTQTTSGVELSLLLSNFQGEDLQITIWDPAGQERYAAITKSFFRRAHAAAIVFSADDPCTWKHVQYWMNELENNAPDDIEMVLICNKIDLLDNVPQEEDKSDCVTLSVEQENLIKHAIEVAANKRIPFYMTSAKSGECVKKAFEELVSQVLHNSAILEKMYEKREQQLIQKGKQLACMEMEDESESDEGGSYVRLRKLKERFSWRKKGSIVYPKANVDDNVTVSVTNFMVEKEMRAGCVTMKCSKW